MKLFRPRGCSKDWKYNWMCPCDWCIEAEEYYPTPSVTEMRKDKQKFDKNWDKMFGKNTDLIKALL